MIQSNCIPLGVYVHTERIERAPQNVEQAFDLSKAVSYQNVFDSKTSGRIEFARILFVHAFDFFRWLRKRMPWTLSLIHI